MIKQLICTGLVVLAITGKPAFAQNQTSMDELMQRQEAIRAENSFSYKDSTKAELEIVAELDFRPGNIAVSSSRRIFITVHPFENPEYTVLEVLSDGSTQPFPNKEWSGKPDKHGKGITAAIGISVTVDDVLYVMDIGSPEHQPKLFAWDIKNDILADTYYIPSHALTPQSFLQDISVDWSKKAFYIADMGQADLSKPARPALITLGELTGYARRLLDSHPALMPPEDPVNVGGQVLKLEDGTPIRAAFNPITILPTRSWVYLAPMGPGMVHKIRTYHLLDEELSEEELESKLVEVGEKPASDGITVDAAGNVYVTDLENNAIGVLDKKGEYRVYIKDDRIDWADGFAFGPDGYVYVTINQLHKAPPLNQGQETSKPPYYIARFRPLAAGAVGR